MIYKPNTAATALVVGDIMLDRYIYGATTRISPEAPVPIVRVEHEEARPGGAANVARNLHAVGIQTILLGVTGDDAAADTLLQQLNAKGIQCLFSRQKGIATITKTRVIGQQQQLLRLDFDGTPGEIDTSAVLASFKDKINTADIVILSDYAKGNLHRVSEFIALARGAGVPVFVDPKGHDFSRYRGSTLITPNQKELEGVVGPCGGVDELVRKADELRAALALDALLVTRGKEGAVLLRAEQMPLHLQAETHEVYDVTGGGDTVIAVLAAALVSGYQIEDAAAIANIAAGIVVKKLGAAVVTTDEINQRGSGKQVELSDVFMQQVDSIKCKGGKIVMTCGCFDVLHAGHVGYMAKARELGDYLIVAVNDDASVRRLKGKKRPIIALQQRLQVLAALASVDWVIPFAEDTPQALIERISPHVLVKGGDYKIADIAGSEHVIDSGGEVVILPLEAGCSTTAIIDRIIKQTGNNE